MYNLVKMKNTTSAERLDVTVERILPFGVFVRLPDGRHGYIRKRELGLDPDIEPSQITQVGQKIDAVILNLGETGKEIELSHRATLQNPWSDFAEQYQVGDALKCCVRAIRPDGIFVRIQPGIDGFIPIGELSPVLVSNPDEIFWVGDNTEAVITRLYPTTKKMTLSINARISQYDQALVISKTFAKNSSSKLPNTLIPNYKEKCTHSSDASAAEKVGPILIVEDDDHVRDSLTTWLKRKQFQASCAKSADDAISATRLEDYKVIIVDLNLLEYDGLELIRHLREVNSHSSFCIMSSPDMLAQRAHDIEAAQVLEVFPKPLDLHEVKEFLCRTASDEPSQYWRGDKEIVSASSQFVTIPFSDSPIPARLQRGLADITSAIRAQIGMIFRLDPDSHAISILTWAGTGHINHAAIYSLRESPVNDVIKRGNSIFENRVFEKALARFDKLLHLLSFGSCMGAPILVQGEVHHAAFFFHPDANAFRYPQLRDVQVGALLLSAILTEQNIQAHISALNPMLLSGELAASFGHDVSNKMTSLELETLSLIDNEQIDHASQLNKILELILDLKNTAQAFQQMLQTKEQMETIDINLVIQRAVILLKDILRKEHADIILRLEPTLPSVLGNSVFLQQAFLNIMLNAVQQMSKKSAKLGWTGKHTLEVTSFFKDDLIQVRFKDNGPGIHKQHLRKIFVPGFSTRGGSGLGLYIARSFIQMLGGTLEVSDTLIPLGTTFLARLPSPKNGDQP